jgi:hypothetical protein
MRSKQTLCVLDETVLAFTLSEARRLYASYGLAAERAEAALVETRGRAALFDARARDEGIAAEAERLAALRGPRPSGHLSLRLVKGNRKTWMGTA